MEYRKKVFKGKQKKIPSNIGLNLYELNKMAYAKMPVLEEGSEEWTNAIHKVIDYVALLNDKDYFMLLNNELHYYTIFHILSLSESINSISMEITDCIKSIGQLIDIEKNEATNTLECWIKQDKNIYMFLFFPYDQGVIECHQ